MDIASENLITIAQARELSWLPKRHGKPPHFTTILAWITIGVGGVKLEAVRTGGAWCTSEGSLRRFFARLAEPRPAKPATAKGRKAAMTAAAARLDAAGI